MNIEVNNPILGFKDIWIYGQHPIGLAESAKHTRDAASEDDRQTGFSKASPSPFYKSWLTKITDKLGTNKSASTHERTLLAGVSGTLLAGQVTVLTGHSGSGKSVLLRVLAGLAPMDTGNVWHYPNLDHRDNLQYSIHDTSPTQWRAQVALLAQHPQLLEGSVLDNLQMPYQLQAHKKSRFDSQWHIENLAYLERTAEFLQQPTSHLSGGERQLVNTLRLLQLSPQVLLLDEPTAALDSETSSKLVKLLMHWLQAKPQRAMLWVTHDTEDIMPLADKHWHMQAGILTEMSSPYSGAK